MRITGRSIESGKRTVLTLDKGTLTAVAEEGAEGFTPSPADLGGADTWIAPAFIDLQVNGYGGLDFNRDLWGGPTRPDETGFKTAAQILRQVSRSGTAFLCPTVCTQSHDAMRDALRDLSHACETDRDVNQAILGIHVEGPYIATEDGPRGAHPLDHVRDPDWDEFQQFQEAAGGRIKLLTLAPERNGAIPFIEKVVESGVTVALGHTAAATEQIQDAVRAGATLSTHLGNAAHAVLPRHPNYIWDQLAEDRLTATIIADGHHLPPAVLKAFSRVKGADRLCLVSDAVALGGCPPGIYSEGRHEVLPSGKVVLAGTPYLAGAGHLLDTCLSILLRFTDFTLAEAVQTVTLNPARILRLDHREGRIAVGYDADLTLFRWNPGGRVDIERVLRDGETVYPTPS